jgi:hypothetical protein
MRRNECSPITLAKNFQLKAPTGAYKATILSLGGPSIQTNPWRKQCYRKTTPAVSLGQPYLHPSAVQTVKYANSEFATAAAQEIKCRKYLALVMEKPPDSPENWTWLVFLVKSPSFSIAQNLCTDLALQAGNPRTS